MTRHPRIPAFAALVIASAAGVGLLAGTGQFRNRDMSQISLEEFEKRIIDCKDGAVWAAYGDKLRSVGKYGAAAKAYEKALDYQPDLTEARLNAALALGMGGNADAFFANFSNLSARYPKLAVDLLAKPELARLRGDPRWEPAAAAARAQAID
jgi:tetratricopeptide (TPR) repeat protein